VPRSIPIGFVVLAVVGLAGGAAAHSEYVDRIPNGGVNACNNCHDSHSFRDDWRRLGWGPKLARKDSDGDGFTNGEELQDPSGSWRSGQPDPGLRKLVSNPSSRNSVPPVDGAPSKAEARCIRELNGGLVQVSEAAGAALRACVEDAAASGSAEAPSVCAASIDLAPKVEKRAVRLEKRWGRRCLALASPPPFGATSSDTVVSAAVYERAALLDDLFGAEPDSALVSAAEDAAAARCQSSLLGATDRCASLALEAFERCKADGLKRRRIGGTSDLAACLDEALAGRLAKRCGTQGSKLAKVLGKRCAGPGTDLAALFPGCGEAASEDLVACVAERLRCRACRAVDQADALGADCDLFDDGSADASCGD